MLTVKKIDNFEIFLSMRKEWNDLLSRSESDNFYLTHEWLSVWWKNLGHDKKLYVLGIKDGNELIASVPFMISQGTFMKFPVRKIEFLGAGWGHGGFLLKDKKDECLNLIWEHIFSNVKFDLIGLSQIRNEINDALLISKNLADKRLTFLFDKYYIPVIKLEGTWEEYLKKFRKGFRKTFENRERFLRKKGRVELSRFKKPFNLDEVMGEVFSISLKSWKAKKGTAIASNGAVRNLYSDLAKELMNIDSLDISLLRLNNEPLAYIFGARYKKSFIDIDIAFNLDFSNVSPGIQLHNFIIKNLLEEDIDEFDFVMAHDYKKEYTDYEREFINITIFNKGFYPKFLYFMKSRFFPVLNGLRQNLHDRRKNS